MRLDSVRGMPVMEGEAGWTARSLLRTPRPCPPVLARGCMSRHRDGNGGWFLQLLHRPTLGKRDFKPGRDLGLEQGSPTCHAYRVMQRGK